MPDFKIKTYKKLQDKIRYLGMQETKDGKPYGYVFLDRLTDSSFLIENTETDYEKAILDRLAKIRKAFEEGSCD